MKYLTQVMVILAFACILIYAFKLDHPKKEIPAIVPASIVTSTGLVPCTKDHDEYIAKFSLDQISDFIIGQKTFQIHQNGEVYTYKFVKKEKDSQIKNQPKKD